MTKADVIEQLADAISGIRWDEDLEELLHAFFELAAEEGRRRATDDRLQDIL
jgi:hypothetical protein